MAVTPFKAETLMGRAFRDAFDRVTFYALLDRSGEWRRCEQMVRCTRSVFGGYTFHVVLARRGRGTEPGDEILVKSNISDPDFARADEELFEDIGRKMAKRANAEVERTYMELPDE